MKEDTAGVMIKDVQQIKVGNGRERDEVGMMSASKLG